MKIIPPYQITSEILNVINESSKYLILVSPYVDFKNWDRIKHDIINAQKRGVHITFYTRFDNENHKSWEQIESLGLKPKLINKLHAKLYFNEQCGIVTSMNLLTSSNLNAIEFGSIYNSVDEIAELKNFVKKFLEPNQVDEKPNQEDLYIAKEKYQIVISNFLSNVFQRNVYCKWTGNYFDFNINNQFSLSIDKMSRELIISGIISGQESKNFSVFEKEYNNKKFKTELFGAQGIMGAIGIISKEKLTSDNFNQLTVWEKRFICESTAEFVNILGDFKNWCYEQNKTDKTPFLHYRADL